MIRTQTFTLDEGLAKHNYKPRLYNFVVNGTKCVRCGIEGKFFAYEFNNKAALKLTDTKGKSHGRHLNLYAIDDKGREVLMTRDHIIPVSRGGSNAMANSQTMCSNCNTTKGNKIEYCPIPKSATPCASRLTVPGYVKGYAR